MRSYLGTAFDIHKSYMFHSALSSESSHKTQRCNYEPSHPDSGKEDSRSTFHLSQLFGCVSMSLVCTHSTLGLDIDTMGKIGKSHSQDDILSCNKCLKCMKSCSSQGVRANKFSISPPNHKFAVRYSHPERNLRNHKIDG